MSIMLALILMAAVFVVMGFFAKRPKRGRKSAAEREKQIAELLASAQIEARHVKLKADETVIFAYIVYTSRAHRDRVNAKVMKDPRLAPMMNPKTMPFDGKRMFWGGFKVMIDV